MVLIQRRYKRINRLLQLVLFVSDLVQMYENLHQVGKLLQQLHSHFTIFFAKSARGKIVV